MSPKRRGDGASRVRGADVDAGLHTETDAGPIDVGLAVSDGATGVVVDAPGLGLLRVAFETTNDGSIRLTALSRQSTAAELFVAPTQVDKARVDRLEAQMAAVHDELEAAQAQAHGLNSKLADGEARVATLEKALESMTAQRAHALEKMTAATARVERIEAKLEATQLNRDKAIAATALQQQAHEAALSALHEQLSTTATTQTTQHEEHEAAVLELREKLSSATLQRDDALQEVRSFEEKLASVEARLSVSEQSLNEVTTERDTHESRAALLREELTVTSTKLEAEFQAHLATRKAAAAERQSKLDESRRSADGLRLRLEHAEKLSKQLSERVAGESRKVFELEAKLGETSRSLTQAAEERDVHLAKVEPLETQLGEATSSLATAVSELGTLTDDHAVLVQRQKRTETQKETLTLRVTALTSELKSTEGKNAELTARVSEAEKHGEALRGSLVLAEHLTRERSEKLAVELQRAAGLEAALAAEKKELAERQGELEEEQALRDEMVRDLAFIQSQVADLATTKGALVSRIDSMSKRETKRQKSTADSLELLRDAEVVAADKQTTVRRLQAYAGRLEEQLVELNQRNEGLEARLASAEAAHAQLQEIIQERDRLKVDIAFFQKQLGAMQRAARPSAPASALRVPVVTTLPTPAPLPVVEAELEPMLDAMLNGEPLDGVVLPVEWSDAPKK